MHFFFWGGTALQRLHVFAVPSKVISGWATRGSVPPIPIVQRV